MAVHQDGLQLNDYDYELPRELIAKYPLKQRAQSRMMVLNRAKQTLTHAHFYQLPDYLNTGDLVVMNNTKVLPARFFGHRQGHTGNVEVLLLNPVGSSDTDWLALMRPAKKLKPGTVIELNQSELSNTNINSTIEVLEQYERGEGKVRIHLNGAPSVEDLMAQAGSMPIPPYLERKAESADTDTYQTVYAKTPGSQAAPTAGLHFTPQVIEALHQKGIKTAEVTLNVGLGTFRDVETDDITQHNMHGEYYQCCSETANLINKTKQNGGKVICIGTTSTKTIETVAQKHLEKDKCLQQDSGWSELFIYPGFNWQVTEGLLTNFHLPKTTLLMMISAFADRQFILKAYETAVKEQYRFYSYGDCMLIV